MKVAMIYSQFLQADCQSQCLGGIETYLLNLGRLCIERGWEPIVIQRAKKPFRCVYKGILVSGVDINERSRPKINEALYMAALKEIHVRNDVIIFGGDHHSISTDNKKTINIQHGIFWDLPIRFLTRRKIFLSGLGELFYKHRLAHQYSRLFESSPNRVCVDYNFYNWYRTLSREADKGNIWIIPNCAEIASPAEIDRRNYSDHEIRIIYARRFTEARGTRIFAPVVCELLRNYSNIYITFAGAGPDEHWLKKQFGELRNVTFIKYLPDESLKVHMDHDIAVIPSIASEGTSLSVAEAMGAGCAVLATAVGGICNMIVNNHNGLLVMPNSSFLLEGLERLINDRELRRKLSINAYETAQNAFNIEVWKKKWTSVIQQVAGL